MTLVYKQEERINHHTDMWNGLSEYRAPGGAFTEIQGHVVVKNDWS